MKTNIKNTTELLSFVVLMLVLSVGSCVTDRDTRTMIYNENVYLDKNFLTRENPNNPEQDDYGWLYNMVVVRTSTPNVVGNFLFTGEQKWPTLGYVLFQMSPDSVQMTDGVELMEGDFFDVTPRVINQWPGEHVDLQLRQNLDGEVTNYEEENKERPWQNRQFFKVDVTDAALDDAHTLSWVDKYYMDLCADLSGVSLVPDSFEYVDTVAMESNMCPDDSCVVDWDKGDYMSWTVRATYMLQPLGYCYDMMSWAMDVFTATIDIKYSFWRKPADPEGEEYVSRDIREKDEYRKKFGIFEALQVYNDPETALTGATFKMSRFNPHKTEPVTYYFDPTFPEEWKDEYHEIADSFNSVMEEADADVRLRFADHDEDNIKRSVGDVRYSWAAMHKNQYTTAGLLGYGPPNIDPRTGETLTGNLNLYDIGLQYYGWLTRDFLDMVNDSFDERDGENLPTPCEPGETRPIIEETVQEELRNTTLYSKLVEYMNEDPDDWIPEHSDDFKKYYQMLLPDIRFAYPPWNTFVYNEAETRAEKYEEMMTVDREFRNQLDMINHGQNPVGIDDATSPGYIEAALGHLDTFRAGMMNTSTMMADKQYRMGMHNMDLVDGPSHLEWIPKAGRKCTDDRKWETFDEWEDRIVEETVQQIATHELGHNLGLRHNFYGSVDAYNSPEGIPGSSVMDYIYVPVEIAATSHVYWPYDEAALIYAYRYDSQDEIEEESDMEVWAKLFPEDPEKTGESVYPERQYLYCTDEHRNYSPICRYYDLGVTPTEIVNNLITRYDWQYKIRNFRSFRQFWDTYYYYGGVFNYIFPMRRFLELWTMDWDSASIENDLRLLGVEGDAFYFQNITEEFQQEMGQANRLVINFFKAIMQQSTGERSYATTFDTFYGDVTRMGIINDKYYAALTFLGLWPVAEYNQDIYSFIAYYEYNWGNSQTYSDSLDVLSSMLGGQYDVYPWFLPLSVLVFAEDTHAINFGDQAKKEWIATRVFETAEYMIEYFSQLNEETGELTVLDPREEALGPDDDGHQVFYDLDGNRWIYVYLPDRNIHVVSQFDKSPASYKLIWDYNEDVNINRAEYVVTYQLKYWIDYYHYFN